MHTQEKGLAHDHTANKQPGSRAPAFYCEAARGLIMTGVCSDRKKCTERSRKARKTLVCSSITPRLSQNAQSKEEMCRKVKERFGRVRSFYSSLFPKCPTTNTGTASTAGAGQKSLGASLPTSLHEISSLPRAESRPQGQAHRKMCGR